MNNSILNMKDLGKSISQERGKQGLTQADLAGLTGLGTRFISDLENSKETLQLGKALIVIGALGLSLYLTHKTFK